MKTLATFSGFQTADLAKARLEAAGIPAFFPAEACDVWVLGAAPIVGGVRLEVSDEDYDRAVEVLAAPPLAAEAPTQS